MIGLCWVWLDGICNRSFPEWLRLAPQLLQIGVVWVTGSICRGSGRTQIGRPIVVKRYILGTNEMKYLMVVNPKKMPKAGQSDAEGELLDILLALVNGIRQGQICAESYDLALQKLVEADRVRLCPIVGEVSA